MMDELTIHGAAEPLGFIGLVISTAAMIVLMWPEKRQVLESEPAGLEVQP